jgi:hypothetical protein
MAGYIAIKVQLHLTFQPTADFNVVQRIQQHLAEEDAGLSKEDKADNLELNLDLDLNIGHGDCVESEPLQLPPTQHLPCQQPPRTPRSPPRNTTKSSRTCVATGRGTRHAWPPAIWL